MKRASVPVSLAACGIMMEPCSCRRWNEQVENKQDPLVDLVKEQCVCRPKKGDLSCWQRATVIESVQLYKVNKQLLLA